MPAVDEAIGVLRTTHKQSKLHQYFEEVRINIRNNLDRFRKQQIAFPNQEAQQEEGSGQEKEEDNFLEFQVNVLVDNFRKAIMFQLLLKQIQRYKIYLEIVDRDVEKSGVWRTDFTKIKAGSLLRADGGYLVLNALDVLIEPGVWQDLKRTLRNGLIDIQTYEPLFGFSAASLKPGPIEINVKVIMIGETDLYNLLYFRDDDFKKIFKIRADFDFEMPKTKNTMAQQHALRQNDL